MCLHTTDYMQMSEQLNILYNLLLVVSCKDPVTENMGDLSDRSPLVSAAASGKLRLVRLLVEGGAHINGCNLRGESALLAACKSLRGEPACPDTLKLITFLLRNKVNLTHLCYLL